MFSPTAYVVLRGDIPWKEMLNRNTYEEKEN